MFSYALSDFKRSTRFHFKTILNLYGFNTIMIISPCASTFKLNNKVATNNNAFTFILDCFLKVDKKGLRYKFHPFYKPNQQLFSKHCSQEIHKESSKMIPNQLLINTLTLARKS